MYVTGLVKINLNRSSALARELLNSVLFIDLQASRFFTNFFDCSVIDPVGSIRQIHLSSGINELLELLTWDKSYFFTGLSSMSCRPNTSSTKSVPDMPGSMSILPRETPTFSRKKSSLAATDIRPIAALAVSQSSGEDSMAVSSA
ncbi:MAG: hypothetical protein BWY14_01226 [Parcubacteria group bacterium ADurb.Bin192]|nr:MAG: hypothetical protein BWY14_01226 [Parcubacteria group bacterium ADurb.Bin192]